MTRSARRHNPKPGSGWWSARARAIIAELDATLPADLPMTARCRALREAYPWGDRRNWPYKAWLSARRAYLNRFVHSVEDLDHRRPTPLELYIAAQAPDKEPDKTSGKTSARISARRGKKRSGADAGKPGREKAAPDAAKTAGKRPEKRQKKRPRNRPTQNPDKGQKRRAGGPQSKRNKPMTHDDYRCTRPGDNGARGEIGQRDTGPGEPVPAGPLARQFLADLMARRGLDPESLDRLAGFAPGRCRKALRCPDRQAELMIAEHLGYSPRDLFPGRYLSAVSRPPSCGPCARGDAPDTGAGRRHVPGGQGPSGDVTNPQRRPSPAACGGLCNSPLSRQAMVAWNSSRLLLRLDGVGALEIEPHLQAALRAGRISHAKARACLFRALALRRERRARDPARGSGPGRICPAGGGAGRGQAPGDPPDGPEPPQAA